MVATDENSQVQIHLMLMTIQKSIWEPSLNLCDNIKHYIEPRVLYSFSTSIEMQRMQIIDNTQYCKCDEKYSSDKETNS